MEKLQAEAPFLFFSSSDDGIILDVNETLCRYLHRTRMELIGQKTDLIFTVPTRIFQQTHFFPLLKMRGHAEEIYLTLQTKEKEQVPVLINATRELIGGEGLSFYAGIVVYNRKKFEDELVAARKAAEKSLHENSALLAAQKELQERTEALDEQMYLVQKQNEELRQFNYVVTHQLQEPLRKLFLFTNMFIENESLADSKKAAQKIVSVAEQMRSILSGLQQYVWLTETPVNRTTLDLNSLAANIIENLQQQFPEVSIQYRAETIDTIEADKEQMRFMLEAVFHNSVRYRKEGETVKIDFTGSELQRNRFRSLSGKYQFAPFLKLQGADSGMGFDPTYKEQVFELFKRLHANSGRGVSLSLCKQIAENHQGSIEIDSRPGEGTVVTILLPRWFNEPAVLLPDQAKTSENK